MINSFFNNPLLYTLVIVIASLLGAGLLILGIYRFFVASDKVNQRMQLFVENREIISPTRNLIYYVTPRNLPGSFLNRTFSPFFQRIINYFGRSTPKNSIAKLEDDLRLAGNPGGLHARGFYGIRIITLFLGIGIAFFLFFRAGAPSSATILLGLAIALIAFLIPRLWLNASIRRRKDELSHNLPDALDMLSVCAIAGMSFDQGLKRLCEFWPTELTEEFKQVLQEMDMGVARSEALRNMDARVKIDELSSFIAIMIQSENTGMSYADVLQGEAKQMRVFRQFRAKESANSLPAKMIVPVALFIFPALIAVILGPVLPNLLNLFQ
jgi:tight adherence protein C